MPTIYQDRYRKPHPSITLVAVHDPKSGSRRAPVVPASGKRPLKTLERVISKAGLGSRTEARQWIGAGRVSVNDRPVLTPDRWVDMQRDRVTFDGMPVRSGPSVYLLLYKPKGYLTTYHDPEGRPTVYDLLEGVETFLSPVGRLDLDTSGLLLMTNDTQFAERMTNPAFKVEKTYLVKTSTRLGDDELAQLRAGVTLSDGPTRPAKVERLRDSGAHTFVEIVIAEGRNRQVRRMIEAVGSRVSKLVRTAIGPIRIGDLQMGKLRPLTPSELGALGGARGNADSSGAPHGGKERREGPRGGERRSSRGDNRSAGVRRGKRGKGSRGDAHGGAGAPGVK